MDNFAADTTHLAMMQTKQADTLAAAKKLDNARSGIDIKKAEKAAEEFEAVFIAEMMKPMFEGIKHDGPFGGGKGEEVFHGMLVQEYGKLIAQTGSVGIADNIKDTMIQMQMEANGMDTMQVAEATKALKTNNTSETNALTDGENDATGNE